MRWSRSGIGTVVTLRSTWNGGSGKLTPDGHHSLPLLACHATDSSKVKSNVQAALRHAEEIKPSFDVGWDPPGCLRRNGNVCWNLSISWLTTHKAFHFRKVIIAARPHHRAAARRLARAVCLPSPPKEGSGSAKETTSSLFGHWPGNRAPGVQASCSPAADVLPVPASCT